jgi:hypothetical protein
VSHRRLRLRYGGCARKDECGGETPCWLDRFDLAYGCHHINLVIVGIELGELALRALALTETRRGMENGIDVGDGTVVGGIVKGGGGGGEVHFR